MSALVEVQVGGLDPALPPDALHVLLHGLFRECGGLSLHSLRVHSHDGAPTALATLGSLQEARLAISTLHGRQVGQARLSVVVAASHAVSLPREEVAAVLAAAPGGRLPLARLQQAFKARYSSSLTLAELLRMWDTVAVAGEGEAKVAVLVGPAGPREVETAHCSRHFPERPPQLRVELPSVVARLGELGERVRSLVAEHGGGLPLASLPHCYALRFPPLLAVAGGEGAAPLEHLLQAVAGVTITAGATGIKRLVDTSTVQEFRATDLLGPPPALATQLLTFTREVVDLLRAAPGCRVPLHQLLPCYQRMYGRPCTLGDYGYTSLPDLLHSLPHVVQVPGEGARTSVTIAHKTQVRRFTNDLLKVLKLQQEKRILLSMFPIVFEKIFFKPFDISNYGVCDVKDMVEEVAEGTVVVEEVTEDAAGARDLLVSVFRREQTAEEVARTRVFAREVADLLRHSADFSISFNKFIPLYHQHFGRQCRVSHYGLAKLAELLECIPETAEVAKLGEERLVLLARDKVLAVVGEQVEVVVRQAGRGRPLPLHLLAGEYEKRVGQALPLGRLGVCGVREAAVLLRSSLRLCREAGEEVVTVVDRGYVRTVTRNARRLLVEQVGGRMEVEEFGRQMAARFGCEVTRETLEDLGGLMEVAGGEVGLVEVHLVARDLEAVVAGSRGLLVADILHRYSARWGRALPLAPLGLATVEDLLAALPDVFAVRGRGARRVVTLAQNYLPATPARPTVAAFSGRGFDMLRLVTPPRPRQVQVHLPPQAPLAPCPPLAPLAPCPPLAPPAPCPPLSLPTASPNSPSTPHTTGTGFTYNIPTISASWRSPRAPAPLTFHHHMQRLAPSPFITSAPSPFTSPSSIPFMPQSAGRPLTAWPTLSTIQPLPFST